MKLIQNPSNPCHRYGLGAGASNCTRTRTRHTRTQVPARVYKPVSCTREGSEGCGVCASACRWRVRGYPGVELEVNEGGREAGVDLEVNKAGQGAISPAGVELEVNEDG